MRLVPTLRPSAVRASLEITPGSPAMLTIVCLRVSNTCEVMGGVLVLKLAAEERVGTLLEEVQKEKGPPIPDNVPADLLTPWKPHSFFPGHPRSDLAGHIHNLHLNSEENCAATEMDPTAELTHYFPQPLSPGLVQIVVQFPPEQIIYKDMNHILRNRHTLPRLHERNLPCVQKIAAWPPTDDGEREVEFRILRVVGQSDDPGLWNENRFIYLAKMQWQVVLVKFTSQYCPELHQFCAQRDHAPKLLGYGTMPGGWKVVVMEFVEHDHDQRARHALQHWVKWEQDLTRLVQDFHGQGLVHGDLRVANFIIPTKQPETIKLIDFDWAGEVGSVYFPGSHLNEELMDETRDSLLITKAHDIRVLNAALGRLKPVTDS